MNLIEAWKMAKFGQVISRTENGLCLSKNDGSFTEKIHNYVTDADLTSDDWEIVKEPKKVIVHEIKWGIDPISGNIYPMMPTKPCELLWEQIKDQPNMTMTLEWER